MLTSQHTHRSLSNPLMPHIGAPLKAYNDAAEATLRARSERARLDDKSKEGKLFSDVVYLNMIRKEFAVEQLRTALSHLRDEPRLYRHSLKKLASIIAGDIARWDSQVARTIRDETYLDYYDELCQMCCQQMKRLYETFRYTILQQLTRLEVPNRLLLSYIASASLLARYCEDQLFRDIDHYRPLVPPIRLISTLSDARMVSSAERLREVLSEISTREMGGLPDGENLHISSDAQTRQAFGNLVRHLSSPAAINGFIKTIDAPKRPEGLPEVEE